MTATAAPELGAEETGSHLSRARQRTSGKTEPPPAVQPVPDTPWRTLSLVLPALLEDCPDWAYLLDGHAPSYGCPVAEGQSWQAAEPGIREDAERAAACQQENIAESLGDAGRRAGWELENRLHTQALHAQAAILHDAGLLGVLAAPSDSAAAGGEDSPAAAGTSSGPGLSSPCGPGPAPDGGGAA